MPKRRSPILEKVKNLMRISSISLTKMRKSVRRVKKFELLSTHYESYGFVREYQISPSDTPLIQIKQRKKRVLEVVFDCFRAGIESSRGRASEAYFRNASMEEVAKGFPVIGYEVEEEEEEEKEEEEEEEEVGNEDGYVLSVDERAERFIHKFYQQMRMQRLHSSNLLLSY